MGGAYESLSTTPARLFMKSSETGPVRTEIRGGIGVVTLANPRRLNAMGVDSVKALRLAFASMGNEPAVNVVVFHGEGRAFCAGLDLQAGLRDARFADPVEAANSAMREWVDLVWTIRSIPQPVVAAIHGHAVGAGFALAVASDVRFVSSDAVFSAPFLRIGMTVGDVGLSWFLSRIVGAGRAAALFYSAGRWTASHAVEIGLASKESEDPLADAMEFADRLAAFPPYGVRESKRLLDAGAATSLRDHLDSEARAQVIGSLTERARAAMADVLKPQAPTNDA